MLMQYLESPKPLRLWEKMLFWLVFVAIVVLIYEVIFPFVLHMKG